MDKKEFEIEALKVRELDNAMVNNRALRDKLAKMMVYMTDRLEGDTESESENQYYIHINDEDVLDCEFNPENGEIFGKVLELMMHYCEKEIAKLDIEIKNKMK